MTSIDEDLSKLKFLGEVKAGDKIDVIHVKRQANSYLTALIRSLIYPDTRINTIHFIRSVVSRSFEIIALFRKDDRKNMIPKVIEDLKRAKDGIFSLKQTYVGDDKFCADIDVLIQSLDHNLSLLEEEKKPIEPINPNAVGSGLC